MKIYEDYSETLHKITVDTNRVITTSPVKRGTLLYKGTPLVVHPVGVVPTDLGKFLEVTGQVYPRDQQGMNAFFSRMTYNSHTRLTNDHLTIFYTGSFFNHSCQPNCVFITCGKYSNRDLPVMYVYSIRDLEEGEECTVCYDVEVLPLSNRDKRREKLQLLLGCDCTCDACADNSPIDVSNLRTFTNGTLRTCATCGDTCVPLTCSRCRVINYCSRTCQKADWKKHKETCK